MPPPKLSFKSWDCALDRTRRRHWDTLERSGGDGGGLGELLLPPPLLLLLLSLELPFPLWVLGFMAMFCSVSLVRYSLFKQWVRFLFYKREWKREMSAFVFSSLLLSFLQKKWKRQEFWMYLSIYVWWLWKYLLTVRSVRFGYQDWKFILFYIYIFFFSLRNWITLTQWEGERAWKRVACSCWRWQR